MADTLRGLKGYAEIEPGKLRGVIIAIDTDSSREERLQETVESITSAGLKSPTKYLEIKSGKHPTDFSIAIMGIPWHDRDGNLDLLLFESMQTTHADLMAPLDTFCDQTKARNEHWGLSPRAKMKLRCTIAASYEDDPGLSLAYLLRRDDCPVDFSNSAFDPISDFLKGFVGKVTKENE